MIRRYRFSLLQDSRQPLPSFWAYRLYAWMLEQVPRIYGQELHMEGETPISQSLWFDRETQQTVWTVQLLTDEMISVFSPVLDELHCIQLRGTELQASLIGQNETDGSQLLQQARQLDNERRTRFCFATATAFKSDGRYAIFPQEKWLLQSLALKWNLICPAMPLDDEDAFAALEKGIHIVDYSLRTVRYPLKNVKIPSFVGNIVIESCLPAPLQEIWQLLVCLAPYTGVGIKTTLGMGSIAENRFFEA